MAKKNHDLPNQQLLDNAYGAFCCIAESMVELNKVYFEQSKAFFETSLQNTRKLYQVSTPEEMTTVLTHIISQNSSILAQAFMEELSITLEICNKVCASSTSGLDCARLDGFQFYDFYSKLLPNPLSLKVDEVVKNAANGSHTALFDLQQVTKKMFEIYGVGVKESAESILNNLDKLGKVEK